MALITIIEADVEIKAIGDLSAVVGLAQIDEILGLRVTSACESYSANPIVLNLRERSQSSDYDHYYTWRAPGLAVQYQNTAAYSATLKITLTVSGTDVIIRWYADAALLDTHTVSNSTYDWGWVDGNAVTSYAGAPNVWVRNYDQTIVRGVTTYNWPWDAAGELDGWVWSGAAPPLTGGYIYDNENYSRFLGTWPACGWSAGKKVTMSMDAMGVDWYAWLSGNDLKVNRLISETPTSGTAVTIDSSGAYDAVADVQFNGPFIRVIVRKSADEKPYAFQSTDMGATWDGPTDIS